MLRGDSHAAADLAQGPRSFLFLAVLNWMGRWKIRLVLLLLARLALLVLRELERVTEVARRALLLDARNRAANVRLGARPVAAQATHLGAGEVREACDAQLPQRRVLALLRSLRSGSRSRPLSRGIRSRVLRMRSYRNGPVPQSRSVWRVTGPRTTSSSNGSSSSNESSKLSSCGSMMLADARFALAVCISGLITS